MHRAGTGASRGPGLDDTSHHNLLAFPYFNFMALTSIRPMSCGCHMQLGKVSVARCSSCPYYHTSYDDTQDPRQRATHHVGQGAVPQYSTNSRSRTPLWARRLICILTPHTVHTNKLFFSPSCPPTPHLTDLFLSLTAAKYTELGSPLFRLGHQSSSSPWRFFQGPRPGQTH